MVLCGLPGSGKTRRAEELRRALAVEGHAVYVVDDTSALGAQAAGAYGDSAKEKELRGALRASVERWLSPRAVVLLDSVNHVGGFRYELYCLARAARTPLCLLYCVRPGEAAEIRGPAGSEAELGESQVLRFEPPDPRRRWDRPLFTVLGPEEPLPLAEIRAALFEDPAPPPHQSTQSQPLASGSFLHQLDQVTSRVLAALMDAQRSAVPGDLLALPGATERLRFTRPVTMAELSRLRRQFISYTKMHPNNENLPQLANMFLQYLSQSLT